VAFSIKIVRRAAREISEAAEWWLANRPAAPDAIEEELRRGFALLASQPGIGAPARNARLTGVRRVYLSRVRYHIYYRVQQSSRVVEVLAFWHASRGSSPNL